MRNVGSFMLSMGVMGSGERISPLLISYSRWMKNEDALYYYRRS
jgi:hypothetical protein